jgi:hypothetical protein
MFLQALRTFRATVPFGHMRFAFALMLEQLLATDCE